MKNAASERERAEAYCLLYRHFERGFHSVLPEAGIGGPALGSHYDFLEIFLDYVKNNGIPLDYIFFHTYGVHPNDLCDGGLRVSSLKEKAEKLIAFVTRRGFGDRIFVNDEWGAATCGYFNSDENPLLTFRETEVFSAYFARLIVEYADAAMPIEKMLICLSGQHEMKTDFSGFRGFFTLNGYPKPIYNAYVLAAKLGEKRLAVEGEERGLAALATEREDGKLAVLLSYSADNFSEDIQDLGVSLEISGRVARVWRIDKEHANAMHAWRLCGSPERPTDEERAKINEMASLTAETVEINGKIDLVMTPNCVILVETEE
jgi:xylan 1,4-beta-xylosidase